MRTRPNITCAAIVTLLLSVLFAALLTNSVEAQTDDRVITSTSVGDALVGSTADEIATQLGAAYTVGDEVRITVDFNGHVVSRDGEVQFRAVKAGSDDRLTLFIVNNDAFTTAEGVGPGTSIADAEAVYGQATLSWNPDNESREFVSFADGPDGRMSFRTPGIAGSNVGIYADGALETNDYDDAAMIAAIWISCVPGTDCAGDAGASDTDDGEDTATEAEPTATPEPEPTAEPTTMPAPTPTPAAADEGNGATSGGSSSTGSSGGELAKTGFEEVLLLSIASAFFLMGGFFLLLNRSYLAPAWLANRRW